MSFTVAKAVKIFVALIFVSVLSNNVFQSNFKENLLVRIHLSFLNAQQKNSTKLIYTAPKSIVYCNVYKPFQLQGPLNLVNYLEEFKLSFLVEFHGSDDFDFNMNAYRTFYKSFYLNEKNSSTKKLTPYDDYFWNLWNTQDLCLLNTSVAEFEFTKEKDSHVKMGGAWSPFNCTSVYKIAIIIPFRDRLPHLKVLSRFLHMFLQRQLVDYRIFVVEPLRNVTFNKGVKIVFIKLFNIRSILCYK